MRRVPVVATIVVVLCVAAMIWLGVWQLQRKAWKEGLLREYAANEHRAPIAFPKIPIGDELLFRRASAFCLEPTSFRSEGAGASGFRIIAACRTGAEGPGFQVQLGTTRDPQAKPSWTGGKVSGFISHVPDHQALIAAAFSHTPQTLMLVADTPPAGLAANPGPNLDDVPNNHLAYAVQWFIFAGIAASIYGIALHRRLRVVPLADRGPPR